jgi:hypothetical protein
MRLVIVIQTATVGMMVMMLRTHTVASGFRANGFTSRVALRMYLPYNSGMCTTNMYLFVWQTIGVTLALHDTHSAWFQTLGL